MKRYLVHYRSPFIGPHPANHVCELCEHTKTFGGKKGYLFFWARFKQWLIVNADSWADTWLSEVKKEQPK